MLFSHARSTKWGLVLAILSAIATAGAAHADGTTFLLQLGSFNSEQQATQKWDDVKGKNADLLGKLTLHVEEVPTADNAMLYRTQAGPIASHNDAASICSSLQGRGVECYVVETALFTPETPPVSAPAVASNMPSPPPSLTSASNAMPGEPSQAAPPPAAAPELPASKPAESAASTPALMPAPSASAPATAETASASAASAPPPAPAPMAVPEPAPASTPPPAAEAPPLPVAAPGGSSPAPAPTPMPAPEPTPAPVSSVPMAAAASAPAAGMAMASAAPDQPVPGRQPKDLAGEAPGSSAGGIVLTPPSEQPVPMTRYAPPPSQEENPGFFTRLMHWDWSSKPANENATGNVNVAEAIHVQNNDKYWSDHATPGLPAVHGLGGTPSETMPKAYWAQMSYFADEGQARGFYDDFRTVYPQFSDGVRVRITRPYASGAAAGHVSLRVGPFPDLYSVHVICMAASKYSVQCNAIHDLGTGAVIGAAHEPVHAGVHWVQLGSYKTSGDAWDEWKRLQTHHRKLLRKVDVTVMTPPTSSAAATPFRLRAGPFVNGADADTLCGKLEKAHESCMVVDSW